MSNTKPLGMIFANSKLPSNVLACVLFAIGLGLLAPTPSHEQTAAAPKIENKIENKIDKATRPEVRPEGAIQSKTTPAKSPAAKRQRLRDCSVRWQDEKKAKGLTGRAAYLKFLSACLKEPMPAR